MKEESISLKKFPPKKTLSIFIGIFLYFFSFHFPSIISEDRKDSQWDDKTLFIPLSRKVLWKDFLWRNMDLLPSGKVRLSNGETPGKIYSLPVPNPTEGLFFAGKLSELKIPSNKLGEWSSSFYKEPFSLVIGFHASGQKDRMVILNKSIYQRGLEYGVKISIVKEYIHLELNRFFLDSKGRRTSAKIISSQKIQKRSWNQILAYFDPLEKSVTLYLNEKYSAGYKETSPDSVGMGFHGDDSTDLILGGDFYGKVGEFGIYKRLPSWNTLNHPYTGVDYNPDSKFVSQVAGQGISPVYKTDFSHSQIRKFVYGENSSPPDTLWELQIRTSLYPFDANLDASIHPWIPLVKLDKLPHCYSNIDLIKTHNTNCFKFYQLRFLAKADPLGENSPMITEPTLHFVQSKPPEKVASLKILPDSDPDSMKVCLGWKGSEEPSVWNGGFYSIHYGFEPGQLAGIIRIPITERKPTYSFCLDNEIIREKSLSYIREKNLPFFRRGTTVYFHITAENRFFSETGPGRDQTSPLSDPVSFTFSF